MADKVHIIGQSYVSRSRNWTFGMSALTRFAPEECAVIFLDHTPTLHTAFQKGVEEAGQASGRKKLIVCGLWTETSVLQSVLGARTRGRDVAVVEDCSGGITERSHQAAIHRIVQAGATPVTW